MPSENEFINAKNKRLDEVPEIFNAKIPEAEQQAWSKLLALLGQVTRDGQGNIEVTQANLQLSNQIVIQLDSIVKRETDYLKSVTQYAGEYDQQRIVNQSYFEEFFDFTESEVGNQIVLNKKQLAVNTLVDISPTLLQPAKATLDNAISTGMNWSEMVTALQTIMIGDDEVDGRLTRHAKQISSDVFSISDRSYTFQVSNDLGIQFFFYSGGLLEPTKNARGTVTSTGTREFCRHRNGKYYHREEIEDWVKGSGSPSPSGQWKGMIAGTNESTIFSNAGGWNCKHSIMPVGETIVPKSVLKRNLNNGNWKPTAKERELLNV